MKQFYVLILALISMNIIAQSTFEVEIFEREYQVLEEETILNNDLEWDDEVFSFMLEAPLNYFGDTITHIVEIGTGAIVGFATGESPYAPNFNVGMVSPVALDLASIPSADGTTGSPISYHISGELGSRVITIQWKQVGFYREEAIEIDSASKVSFQLIFYEQEQALEFHYGRNEIINPDEVFADYGGLLAFAGFLTPFTEIYAGGDIGYGIQGNTTDFNLVTLNIEQIENEYVEIPIIDPYPTDGTVIRWTKGAPSSNKNLTQSDIKIYPTAVTDILNIEQAKKPNNLTYHIFNTKGQLVSNGNMNGDTQLNTTEFSKGLYKIVFKNNDTNQLSTFSFIKI